MVFPFMTVWCVLRVRATNTTSNQFCIQILIGSKYLWQHKTTSTCILYGRGLSPEKNDTVKLVYGRATLKAEKLQQICKLGSTKKNFPRKLPMKGLELHFQHQ